jgi:hypothetical protein
MKLRLFFFALTTIALLGLAAEKPGARVSVGDLLDRYAAGQFDSVVSELEALETWDPVLTHLREHGETWIAAKGPTSVGRRKLVAATFALEAARAGQWHEWKIIRKQPLMCAEPETASAEPSTVGESSGQQQMAVPPRPNPGNNCYMPPDVLRWQPPALILEWGCELLRRQDPPLLIERWWQLAALAVAQRSEDPQFLIGDENIGRGPELGEIVNTQDEIKHLEHVMERFPKEARFQLAYGIAQERSFPADAMKVYRGLERDPDVAGEAMMRLGGMQVRRRSNVARVAPPQTAPQDPSGALRALEKAEILTRDPYVVYLARYFAGQLHLAAGRSEKAESAFRGAVAAIPGSEAANIALAALVFRDGRRTDAQRLIGAVLDAQPKAPDPWRTYVHADDRFWPRLIVRLREEIVR